MLELRPSCENCNKALPPNSTEAMICTFECTWCKECNDKIFKNVCPNCGGDLVPRPIRPQSHLDKHPPTEKVTHNPIDLELFITKRDKLINILPKNR